MTIGDWRLVTDQLMHDMGALMGEMTQEGTLVTETKEVIGGRAFGHALNARYNRQP